MDDGTRKRLRNELTFNRSKTCITPAWLLNSVLQLVANHEAGYLERCRKCALRVDGN